MFEMNGTYEMTPEQRIEWEADSRPLYDGMVRIVVTPKWAEPIDFETTLPSAVAELARHELDAALPRAPTTALDRRQRPIPWWRQWLDYLDGARGHGGIRVHCQRSASSPAGSKPALAPDPEVPMPQEPNEPRHPDVWVQLTGEDGNAFAILGRTARALRQAGLSKEEVDEYYAEATAGDYDHLLQTTMRWVDWE